MIARPRPVTDESAARALGQLLREAGEPNSTSTADSARERLLRAARSTVSARQPRGRVWALALAAAAVVALLGVAEWRRREAATLTFSANGVPGHEHTAVASSSGRAIDLAFSDGSVFDVEPAGRLRVESLSATGARLTLVEGKTVAHVVHRPSSSWSVAAGPFEVRVTGTRFGASWDASGARLTVELYEGSVQVSGGALTTPIAVRAGQRLEAGKGTGDWLLTSLEHPTSSPASSPANIAAPADAVAPVAAPFTEPSAAAASSGSTERLAAPALDFPALLGRADFEGIVRRANEFGLERCFATCAPADLRMLADSARYLGRHELAERSLLVLRKRSPADGASTAFLLGRLEEPRAPRKALSWYEKSLEEGPSGAYAEEAWAGKMRLLLQTGGPAAAAPSAERYLRRNPRGPYAKKAREILSQAGARGDGR